MLISVMVLLFIEDACVVHTAKYVRPVDVVD